MGLGSIGWPGESKAEVEEPSAILSRFAVFEKLSPILCAVPDMEDLNDFAGVTVDDNVTRNDKLTCASDLARAARCG